VECFRIRSSFLGHRISPLARKYGPPRLFPFKLQCSPAPGREGGFRGWERGRGCFHPSPLPPPLPYPLQGWQRLVGGCTQAGTPEGSLAARAVPCSLHPMATTVSPLPPGRGHPPLSKGDGTLQATVGLHPLPPKQREGSAAATFLGFVCSILPVPSLWIPKGACTTLGPPNPEKLGTYVPC